MEQRRQTIKILLVEDDDGHAKLIERHLRKVSLANPIDRVRDGLHAGSKAVRDFVDRVQPEYFFCGHIHEAEGVTVPMGKTRAANVGKRGYLLELD